MRLYHEITSVVLRIYECTQVRESGRKVRDIHELVVRNIFVTIMCARFCMFVNSTMLCSCLSRYYLVPNIVNFTNIRAHSAKLKGSDISRVMFTTDHYGAPSAISSQSPSLPTRVQGCKPAADGPPESNAFYSLQGPVY